MVKLLIPATTANVGPGFDTLGCAFNLYTRIEGDENCSELKITGCDPKFRGDDNLAVQGYRAAMEYMGLPIGGLSIDITSDIPQSRGLGSSAAVIAGGAALASALHENRLTKAELLKICTPLEGHPDNLSPAIFGGFTASFMENGVPYSTRYEISPRLKFCALIPDFTTSTHEARLALPQTVAYSDAVYNVTHVAVLLKALENGDTALIAAALSDRLHQPYRKRMIHEYERVMAAAHECGCVAFFISGSGPTCMCITDRPGFETDITKATAGLEHNWQVKLLSVDYQGVRAV